LKILSTDDEMKVFYGAAIQGAKNREERSKVHQFLINTIKKHRPHPKKQYGT